MKSNKKKEQLYFNYDKERGFDIYKKPRKYYEERFDKNYVEKTNSLPVIDDTYGLSLEEVYNKHVIDYKTLIPDKKVLKENNKINIGAYGNGSYAIDQVLYVNENPMNGGQLDENLYGYDEKQSYLSVF